MIFSTACFLAYFWATYYVPETANISLEEIDKVFRSSAGREDEMMRRQVSLLRCSFGRVLTRLAID